MELRPVSATAKEPQWAPLEFRELLVREECVWVNKSKHEQKKLVLYIKGKRDSTLQPRTVAILYRLMLNPGCVVPFGELCKVHTPNSKQDIPKDRQLYTLRQHILFLMSAFKRTRMDITIAVAHGLGYSLCTIEPDCKTQATG
jgi:DNA-binding response OmpR family regulator